MDQQPTLAAILTGWVVLGILSLGIGNWVVGFWKLWNRQPLVAWEPRRSPPWGLFDLIVAGVLWIGGTIVAAQLMQSWGLLPAELSVADATPRETALLMLGSGIAQLIVIPLLLVVISLRTGATAKDLGFVPGKFLSDLRLGVTAFTMLLPLVYVIQAILTRYQKYEHELLEVMKELPGWEWAVGMVFVAGVSAPIVEEILFRLLLQGWLEKLFGFLGPTHELVLGAMRGRHVDPSQPIVDAQLAAPADRIESNSSAFAELRPSSANPYAPTQAELGTDEPVMASLVEPYGRVDPHAEMVPPQLRRWGWIAIAISSLVFALLHWSHGPAWVALTVLAAGMGYLYQRTHRLAPSLVVHGLLNNLTMLIVLFNPEAA